MSDNIIEFKPGSHSEEEEKVNAYPVVVVIEEPIIEACREAGIVQSEGDVDYVLLTPFVFEAIATKKESATTRWLEIAAMSSVIVILFKGLELWLRNG